MPGAAPMKADPELMPTVVIATLSSVPVELSSFFQVTPTSCGVPNANVPLKWTKPPSVTSVAVAPLAFVIAPVTPAVSPKV